ncbi:transposase [sulfur-oxidizing endosymbiont of Gigantopelta aegis]|uniref:transposase n=1 Tax=sulfur-oxidizing endosymbiont of Gigantopelta aegis TaxID=2794934 RepID=UPI0018DD7438|nr:transposase [sulfur-oxidizing endosymbiont of Gigantopelta aegis]
MLSVIEQKNHRIKILEEALRLARSKRFAPSSEKSDGQERLFDEAEQAADDEGLPEPKTTSPKKKEKTGRKPFSKTIPRVPVFIDLTDEEKAGAIEVFTLKSEKSWISFQLKSKYWNTSRKKPSLQAPMTQTVVQ